ETDGGTAVRAGEAGGGAADADALSLPSLAAAAADEAVGGTVVEVSGARGGALAAPGAVPIAAGGGLAPGGTDASPAGPLPGSCGTKPGGGSSMPAAVAPGGAGAEAGVGGVAGLAAGGDGGAGGEEISAVRPEDCVDAGAPARKATTSLTC